MADIKLNLTPAEGAEIAHKMQVLADTPDLQDDYQITQDEAQQLANSVPENGGVWTFDDRWKEMVAEELEDAALILADMAKTAKKEGEPAIARRELKLAGRIQELAEEARGDAR